MSQIELLRALSAAREGRPGAMDAYLMAAGAWIRERARFWQAGMLVRQGVLDDVVQTALFDIWRHTPTCRAHTEAELRAWLWSVTRYVAIDAHRVNRAAGVPTISMDRVPELLLAETGADDLGASSDAVPLIAHVLGILDRHGGAPMQELMWRRVVREESWEEVGTALGISWTAARRRYQRATAAVRASLLAAAHADPALTSASHRLLRRLLRE